MDPKRIAEHTGYLMRYARSRVRDEHLAEEAVQETLLAALESLEGFDGRATLRTWLTGILVHKIHDGFRRDARKGEMPSSEPEEPIEWLTPDHALHVKRLCGEFADAVAKLPPRQKEALTMRAVDQADTDRMCRKLGVTRSNLWVLLHRARATLRDDLERRGYTLA